MEPKNTVPSGYSVAPSKRQIGAAWGRSKAAPKAIHERASPPQPREGTMNTTSQLAVEILHRSAVPAVPLAHLIEAMERETGWPRGTAESVVRDLRATPLSLRVLNSPIGVVEPGRRGTVARMTSSPLEHRWVLRLTPPRTPSVPPLRRLGESMRAVARQIDERSVSTGARCLLLMTSGADTFTAIGAASEDECRRPAA